jgi:hypothetical protein
VTKDEALRLALEALEDIGDEWGFTSQRTVPKRKEAITAIKEALAQPEQDLVEWGVDWGPDGNSVSIIKRLADGGIEVVGWEYAPHPPQRTWVGLTEEEMLECLKAVDVATAVNLLMSQYEMPPTFKVYAQAIEAKLKEKNT